MYKITNFKDNIVLHLLPRCGYKTHWYIWWTQSDMFLW